MLKAIFSWTEYFHRYLHELFFMSQIFIIPVEILYSTFNMNTKYKNIFGIPTSYVLSTYSSQMYIQNCVRIQKNCIKIFIIYHIILKFEYVTIYIRMDILNHRITLCMNSSLVKNTLRILCYVYFMINEIEIYYELREF